MIIPYDKKYLEAMTHLFLDTYQRDPWNDEWPSYDTANTYLTEFTDNPHFIGFIALEDEKVVGACFGHKKTWWEGVEYFVDEFFIDTNRQGKGIGSTLIEHIKRTLAEQGFKAILLMTERGYPAEKFYIKNGFKGSDTAVFMVASTTAKRVNNE